MPITIPIWPLLVAGVVLYLLSVIISIYLVTRRILRILIDIRAILTSSPDVAVRATLSIEGAGMPATIGIGKTAQAIFKEFNAAGTELPPKGPVEFTSSDATIATVEASSGLITAVAVGTCTINGLDTVNRLSAGDSLGVEDAAVSATLTIVPN